MLIIMCELKDEKNKTLLYIQHKTPQTPAQTVSDKTCCP